MLIEVWSDVVCPWCYIGKRKLELALSQYEGPEPEVRYRAFQLDPRAPRGPGTPVREAYAKKFGGEDAADRILQRVTDAAAEVGLGFRMDRAIRANTLDAHRLLALALDEGVQRQLKEELLQAYFVDGQDIGAESTLVARGVSAGLAEDRIREWLAGPGGLDRVRADLAEAEQRDIAAVPSTVFAGGFPVPGAQEPDTFLKVLERTAERLGGAG